MVLERNLVSGTTYADTYYSYDHLGNLLWTVTPQGSSNLANGGTYNYSHPVASLYSYIYAYDGLNHLIEKKQPGRERETYVRDRAGREMMYQDGNMRQSNQWLCTAYDNLNRVTRKYVTSNRVGNLTPASTGSTTPALPEVKVLYQAMHYGYNTASEDPATDLPYAATSTVSQLDLANFTHGALKYEKHLLLIEGTQELYKETAYYYNNKGELLQSVTRYPNGNILRTSYRYNFTGDITTKEEVYNGVTKLTNCTYDNRGKLLTETTTINGGAAATVTYAYDDLGRVTSRSYGNGTTETQQYNIQGWATTLSAKRGQSNIYTQTLHYYNPTKGTAALYSGNISEWSSQQASQQQETYGFTYDLQGRLTQSNRYSGTGTSAQSSYTERGITYDRNGNILTLQRYASALQDNYTYTYNGNRLTSISGTNNGTAIASASYSYDNNGNTVQDGLKGLQISYNILNLPQTVTQSGTTKATYGWFADGSKYSVQDAQGNGYHYIGSLIYSNTAGTTSLESTDFSGGRIVLSGNTQAIHYHHKDHLGSVRAITDGSGSTIEQNAYYPFGGRHTFGQTYAQTTANRYKFNGKELQTIGGLDLLDYGARMYDTKTARWLVQDPLAEKYYPFSPYSFSGNNPVMNIDRDGKAWDVFIDVASFVYDIGSAIYNHAKGNHSQAKQNWVDVGVDVVSMAVPGLAAPVAKGLVKGIDKATDVGKTINIVTESASKAPVEQIPTIRGKMNESKVLNDLGLKKNTTKVQGKTVSGEIRNTIPDAITSDTVYEIKDVKTLSNTKQIQAQMDYAIRNGLDYKIITGINTHVSTNIPKKYIIRLDYIGPQK